MNYAELWFFRNFKKYLIDVLSGILMTTIQTSHNTLLDILNQGFSLLPAEELLFSADLQKAKDLFLTDWENLALDEHMQDGGTYRYRRYGKYSLNANTKNLCYLGSSSYYQSEEMNPLNGGTVRKFEPLLIDTVDNTFLRSLILFDFSQLPIEQKQHQNWNVGIHQIRILAKPDEVGHPAPEGIHKDGEMFTVQHLIRRENVVGGENTIYDNDKNPLHTWVQQKPFDSYYFEDEAVYHSVSEIHSKDETNVGYRDILLIDFDPLLEPIEE